MTPEVHFLHLHLDFPPENCGAVSNEHGEHLHRVFADTEKRYTGNDRAESVRPLSDQLLTKRNFGTGWRARIVGYLKFISYLVARSCRG